MAAATGADTLTDGHSSFVFILLLLSLLLFRQYNATVCIVLLLTLDTLDFSLLPLFSRKSFLSGIPPTANRNPGVLGVGESFLEGEEFLGGKEGEERKKIPGSI